jgi:hypothetical protein
MAADSIRTSGGIQRGDPGHVALMGGGISWVMGYLSAFHQGNTNPGGPYGGDFLGGLDEDTVVDWIRDDCAANPQKTIHDVAKGVVAMIRSWHQQRKGRR